MSTQASRAYDFASRAHSAYKIGKAAKAYIDHKRNPGGIYKRNMPKRYTRKKRTFRRRKVVRRRRRGAPRVRPDGMHKEKVTIAKEFKTNGTTSAFMAFHWLSQYQQPNFADYNATYAGDNRQHFAISSIYKFFRVYGMQIKYIPYIYG